MKSTKRKKQIFAWLMSCMLLLGIVIPSNISVTDAAAETALCDKKWEDIEDQVNSKNGTGYQEIGLCTGFVCWVIRNVYGVDSWPTNGTCSAIRKECVDRGLTNVPESQAKPGDIAIFRFNGVDTHVAIVGKNDTLHHAYDPVVVHDDATIAWWEKYGYNGKTGDVTLYRGLASEVELTIEKRSGNEEVTEGNDCYSVEGAKFEVVNSSGKTVATITTDEDGRGSASVPKGKYTIKEVKAPKGYAISDKSDNLTVNMDEDKTVIRDNDPQGDPVNVLLGKIDEETTKNMPQGSASLEGAQFKVEYFTKQYKTDEAIKNAGAKAERTWIFQTNENGLALYSANPKYFVSGDDFYRDSNGDLMLPLGSVRITEVKAPKGYEKNTEFVHVDAITSEGNTELVHTYDAPTEETAIKEKVFRGGVKINKQDTQTDDKEQGDASFLGAQFSIINKSENPVMVDGKEYAAGQVCKVISTNENDIASTSDDCLPFGKYTIKETKPPTGYKNTGIIERDFEVKEKNVIVDLTKSPIKNDVIRGGVQIEKWDKELDKSEALGGAEFSTNYMGARLTGIEFTIKNKSKAPVVVNEKTYQVGDVVAKIKTSWNEEKEAYTAQTPVDYLPYGTYTIQETGTNETYKMTDSKIREFEIRKDGELVTIDKESEPLVAKNKVVRGDIEFVKAKEDAFDRLKGVPFKITNLTTKEAHVLVTDANGEASTSSEFNKHSKNTNANDKLLTMENIKLSDIDMKAGIWFSQGEFGSTCEAIDDVGALPYGTYQIDELRCEANEGLTLIKGVKFEVSRDGYTINLGTVTDKEVDIKTTAWDAAWASKKSQYTMARANITIIDRVRYDGLEKGKEYILRGTIMDKETGLPILINGKEITSETKFRAEGKTGNVDAEFNFNASKLAGKDTIVYERLFEGNQLIAYHEDLSDEDQRIRFLAPEVGTTALDGDTKTHYSVADDEVVIIDTIKFSGLLDGQQYVMRGTLVDKETGEPFLSEGKEIVEEKEFFTNTGKGTQEMIFKFNGSHLEGKDAVVFEEILWEGEVVAHHRSLSSLDQTIHFPGIKTMAKDSETMDHISNADEEVTITDTVTYWNVMPGQNYEIFGRLIDKETEKMIAKATAKFTAEESQGTVEVTFEFNGADFAGKDVVIFEELNFDGVYDNQKIAKHTDLEDALQTIHLPKVETTALDSETNHHISMADGTVTIVDTVEYSNVLAGKEYTVTGKLMDKESGKPILMDGKEVTATKTFTAEKTEGTVELTFTLNASEMAGKTAIVFERLSLAGKIVGQHESLDDEEQSIHFPELGTTLTDAVSKNHITFAGKKVVLTDVVSYKNVVPGEEYTVKGILMDKSTEKPMLDADGKEIISEKTFKAESFDGTVEVTFEFDARGLEGKAAIAFEDLYFGDVLIAHHRQIESEDQTVVIPKIGTTALDSETNDHISFADGKVKIIDTVTYENVIVGKEYEVEGYLVSKLTGWPVKINGEKITASAKFTAEKPDGRVELEFVFDGRELAGKSLVAYEELKLDGHLIGEHKNKDSQEQTIVLPEVGTSASDKETGNRKILHSDGKKITIIDKVKYKNLLPGKTYKVSGILMDKATGKPVPPQQEGLDGIIAEKVFLAEKADGTIEMEFTLDISQLDGRSLVVFEDLYLIDEKNRETIVASHSDINDKKQTLEILPPSAKTGGLIPPGIMAALLIMVIAGVAGGCVIRRRRKYQE